MSIDRPMTTEEAVWLLVISLLVLVIMMGVAIAINHKIVKRRQLAGIVPPPPKRGFYPFTTLLLLGLLFAFWPWSLLFVAVSAVFLIGVSAIAQAIQGGRS